MDSLLRKVQVLGKVMFPFRELFNAPLSQRGGILRR